MAINFFGVRHGLTLGSLTSAPLSPLNGDIYFDGTQGKFQFYQDNQWTTYGDPLKAYTLGKILQSNSITGLIEASTVDSTVLAYLDATSSIQNQLNSKIEKSLMTAKGDIIVRNATVPTVLPVGLNDYVLTADSTTATGLKWAAAVSGANTSLSNLTSPTSINQSLVASDTTKTLGTSLTPWLETWTYNQKLKGSTTGILTIKAADATTPYTLTMPSAVGSNGQVLTTDISGNLSWTTPSGTGANTSLSNLTLPTSINQDLIPFNDQLQNLGTNLKAWNNLYVGRIRDSYLVDSINPFARVLTDSVGGTALEWANSVNPGVVSYLDLVPASNILNFGSLEKYWESIYGLNYKFVDSTSTNSITLKAPDTFAADFTLTLPSDDGDAGQVLTSDGSGNLSWTTPATTGANTALSNLTSPTSVNQDLVPQLSSLNMGSSARYWNNIFVKRLFAIDNTAAIDISDTGLTHTRYLKDSGTQIALSWNQYGVGIQTKLLPLQTGVDLGSVVDNAVWANVYSSNYNFNDLDGNVLTLTAPAGTAAITSHTLTLPGAQGAAATVLTNDGAGNLTWSTPAGTGANKSLSNLTSPTSVNQDLIPSTTSINLGSLLKPWNLAYIGSIQNALDNTAIDVINNLLIATDGSASLDWDSRNLSDSTGAYSLYWNTRQLVNSIGDIILDWSGLSDLSIYKNIIPASGYTPTLGTNSAPWTNVYTKGLKFLDSTIHEISIVAPTTVTAYTLTLPSAHGSNGEVLTTDGTGHLSWGTPAGTGANKSLSNLTSPTSVNQDLIPSTTSMNLGSLAKPWNLTYIGSIQNALDNTAIDVINNSLVATDGNISLDWSARKIYDLSGSVSLDWSSISYIASNKDIVPISGLSNDLGTNISPWNYVKTGTVSLVNASAHSVNITVPSSITPHNLVMPSTQGAVSTVLTNDGSGNLSWTTVSGTGANTALSNLTSPTAVSQDLIAGTSGLNLGNNTTRWNSLHVNTISNTSNTTAINLSNDRLFDSSTNLSLDWNNRYLVDGVGDIAAHWGSRYLQDASNHTSLDWLNRYLYDSAGSLSLQWSGTTEIFSYKNIIPDSAFSRSLGTSLNPWGSTYSSSFRFVDAGSNVISLLSPSTITPYSLTMPPAQGAASTVLTNDGFGTLSWATPSGSGANTTLSNLTSPTSVNQDLIPSANNTHDLGSTAKIWGNLYTSSLKDTSDVLILDTASRELYDSSGVSSILFGTRSLIDSSGIASVNYGSRTLYNSSGNVLDWSGFSEAVVHKNLIPAGNLSQSLGDANYGWLNTHTKNVVLHDASTHTVTLTAPSSVTSYTLTLPAAQGASGQTLTNDGLGDLSWTTPVPFASPTFTGTVTTTDIKATNLASASDTARGIVYTDTLGNLEIDTLDLIWDETNKRLGINQQGSVSSATVDIHSTTFTVPIAQFNQKSTTQNSSSGSIIQLQTDPSAAMLSGSRIGVIQFAGATDASHTTAIGSGINSIATENWTSSANGSKMGFYTTLNGTTGRVLALQLDHNQNASFSANVSITGTTSLSKEIVATQITTPTSPSAGTNKIYAKSDNKLYILNSAGVESQVGGGATSYLSVIVNSSSTYALTSSNDVLVCDCTSTSQTITLPSPTGLSGKVFNIKKTDSTANTITISGGTIDSDGAIIISAKNESKTLVTDGSVWFII